MSENENKVFPCFGLRNIRFVFSFQIIKRIIQITTNNVWYLSWLQVQCCPFRTYWFSRKKFELDEP